MKKINLNKNNSPYIIDCTLRDGGLAVDVPSDVAKVEKALKKINKSIFLQ